VVTATTATSTRLLAELDADIAHIFTELDELAAAYAALVADHDGAPRREDLAALRPSIFGLLSGHRQLISGSGVITAPGLLLDSHYWLEWWWTRTSGTPEALRVNLDPAAPDFFDYTTTDWYSTPERTAGRHVAGPYVDYTCTNEYSVTLAVPVHAGERLTGVAAADVPVSRLERQVLPALRGLPTPMALVNPAGRVIASGSPLLAPGQLVRTGDDGDAVVALPTPFWRLVPVPPPR
jgi:hypothetical protein